MSKHFPTDKQEQDFFDDMVSWANKCNMMVLNSTEGICPQYLKAIMMREFSKEWCENFKKKVKPEEWKTGEKLLKEFLKFNPMVESSKEHLEEYLYGDKK